MRAPWFALISVSLLSLAGFAHGAPLEVYAALPKYENVAISPDGDQLAFITTVGSERELIIQPLAANGTARRIKVGSQKLRALRWVGSDQLVFTTSVSSDYLSGPQYELASLNNFDLRRQRTFRPTEWPKTTYTTQAADSAASAQDVQRSLYVHFVSGSDRHFSQLYRVDFERQLLTLLDASPHMDWDKSYQWTVGPAGNLLAQTVYDEKNKRWSLALRRSGKWEEIHSEDALIDLPSVVGAGPQPDSLLVNRIENGQRVARPVSLRDGTWGSPLVDDWISARYLFDTKTNRTVVGVEKTDQRLEYRFFDDKLQQAWNQIRSSFPGEEIKLLDRSDTGKYIVQVFGQRTGFAYAMVDQSTQQYSFLGDVYAGIKAADIQEVRPFKYAASDGLQIGAYLTIPTGKPSKNLPLIVLPHGGPAARDILRFDWIAQALAAQGYLVLQPNFRGSSGVTSSLLEAGHGEWGRKMQTDLSDGVRALVKLGAVDPSRVCIVGASYGGYAALAGATQEPEVYRCAVSVAGISDLKKLLQERVDVRITNDNLSLRFGLRYVGAANLQDPILAERSPATQARHVKGPVLLIHGDNDSVVPLEQSTIMATTLKKADKSFAFVKLKSEDHWLSRADTRLQMLQATVRFLVEHNPP